MTALAFIGSARHVIQEISERNLTTTTFPQLYNNNILTQNLPFVNELQQNWNHFLLSLNQQHSSNSITQFTTDMFLALSPSQLQHNLFNKLMDASKQNLISISEPMDKIRSHSCSGKGAAAFFRPPTAAQGGFLTNAEFKIAGKIRINAPLHLRSPSQYICGDNLNDFGFRPLK